MSITIDTLVVEKRLYIENNIDKFVNEIEFCRKINEYEQGEISQEEETKLENCSKV